MSKQFITNIIGAHVKLICDYIFLPLMFVYKPLLSEFIGEVVSKIFDLIFHPDNLSTKIEIRKRQLLIFCFYNHYTTF